MRSLAHEDDDRLRIVHFFKDVAELALDVLRLRNRSGEMRSPQRGGYLLRLRVGAKLKAHIEV